MKTFNVYPKNNNNKIECPKCGYSFKLKTNKSTCRCDSCSAVFNINKKTANKYELTFKKYDKFLLLKLIIVVDILPILFLFSILASFLYFANYEEYSKKLVLLDNIEDINKNEFEEIDVGSVHYIYNLSHLDENNGFKLVGNCSRYKTYLINEKYSNKFIPVYLCNYSNGNINYSIYSPVLYKDVYINLKNKSVIDDFPRPSSDYNIPTVYFNSDKSEYTVGYKDFNELYHSLSHIIDGDYPIIEK